MGIYREVNTEAICDECGEVIGRWSSAGTGVSREWAKYYVRETGGMVREKSVMCKECRIKERQKRCTVIKKAGHPGIDADGKCLGYDISEGCRKCIAYCKVKYIRRR